MLLGGERAKCAASPLLSQDRLGTGLCQTFAVLMVAEHNRSCRRLSSLYLVVSLKFSFNEWIFKYPINMRWDWEMYCSYYEWVFLAHLNVIMPFTIEEWLRLNSSTSWNYKRTIKVMIWVISLWSMPLLAFSIHVVFFPPLLLTLFALRNIYWIIIKI